MKNTAILALLLSISSSAFAEPPVALIYKGMGSCSKEQGDAGKSGYGCSEASADAAKLAGFTPKYVSGEELNKLSTGAQVESVFKNAKVWIQPGGIATTAMEHMSDRLIKEVQNFVRSGGGYVGFCAGAFTALTTIGENHVKGFGFYLGEADDYEYTPIDPRNNIDYQFERINWKETSRNGSSYRYVYFEGGANFEKFDHKTNEVMAKFENGKVAAIRTHYGKGGVYLAGPHPEAPAIWSEEDKIHDPDGSDLDIAANMIKWAAHPTAITSTPDDPSTRPTPAPCPSCGDTHPHKGWFN
jgi:glutamine amidotransferase-like uncharacterized protein